MGTTKLIISILFGSGLRLNECLSLRVKDMDLDLKIITVREGKGGKDRTTVLPASLNNELIEHLKKIYDIHIEDLKAGYGEVLLPHALSSKYPNASKEFKCNIFSRPING